MFLLLSVLHCFPVGINIDLLQETISMGETMRVNELATWEAFLGVAKHGNFTTAGKALRIPTPQVSKRIAKLEERLGVRLFQRSTRVVTLTDEGQSLVPKVAAIIEDLSSVESQFEGEKNLKGTIRLTCVPFVAHRILPNVLARFGSDYPDIRLEIELSKEFRNLIEEGLDMAIRIETPKDADLVYRKMAPNDLVLCASPLYLKNAAPLHTPEDLVKHKLLMLDIHHRVKLTHSNKYLGDFQDCQRVTCKNGAFLTDLALQHQGILVRSIWDVQEKIQKRELVEVLPSYPLESFGHIYAVIPTKRYLARRVRLFLDYVLKEAETLQR